MHLLCQPFRSNENTAQCKIYIWKGSKKRKTIGWSIELNTLSTLILSISSLFSSETTCLVSSCQCWRPVAPRRHPWVARRWLEAGSEAQQRVGERRYPSVIRTFVFRFSFKLISKEKHSQIHRISCFLHHNLSWRDVSLRSSAFYIFCSTNIQPFLTFPSFFCMCVLPAWQKLSTGSTTTDPPPPPCHLLMSALGDCISLALWMRSSPCASLHVTC